MNHRTRRRTPRRIVGGVAIPLVRCLECQADIPYERTESDSGLVIEVSRALALHQHDIEEHWPTVVTSTSTDCWVLRCVTCHGPVSRFTFRPAVQTLVSPCGHREGVEHLPCRTRQPTGRLVLVDKQTHATWIVEPDGVSYINDGA